MSEFEFQDLPSEIRLQVFRLLCSLGIDTSNHQHDDLMITTRQSVDGVRLTITLDDLDPRMSDLIVRGEQ
jgi:hypothetical protein